MWMGDKDEYVVVGHENHRCDGGVVGGGTLT